MTVLRSIRRIFTLGSAALLAVAAPAQTPPSPPEMRREPCQVLNDAFEGMKADWEDQRRRSEVLNVIHHEILGRLDKADLETVKRFFECFELSEEPPTDDERRRDVVRTLAADIIVGHFPVVWSKENPVLVDRPVIARVVCRQRSDGTHWCWGRYYPG